jgi:ABC-type uncharacterized transport system substrate-binding protein
MNRREFIAMLSAAAGWPLVARAQHESLPKIGFLSSLSATALSGPVTSFREGLGSVGYEDGKNVAIAFHWAEGHYDLLPALAADLVKQQPAVIVTVGGDPAAFAAKAASSTIPLVFMVGQDPVKLGLVTSLNRPGGNATGINLLVTETETKRVEILKQLVPSSSNWAALINPKNADASLQSSAIKAAAHSTGKQIEVISASSDVDLDNAFAHFTITNINGLLLLADPFFVYRRQRIIAEVAKRHIPAIYFLREFAESGGLASYGTSLAEAYRQAGIYAGKVLAGTKPAELPVIQAAKFEFVINLKTAQALGLTVPEKLLATADEVIE